jgi:hypothetical protein
MRGCRVTDDDLLLAQETRIPPLRQAPVIQRPVRPGRHAAVYSDLGIRGNTEGTPAQAQASTRGHSSSTDSSDLRDLRARGFPGLPSVPASSLDGKEGVDGSSPSEGFTEMPANRAVSLSRP